MKNIYKRIITITEKNNISGVELGRILGLKKSPLTDWKNEKSKPTVEQIIQICEYFAISTDWLLTGKEAADLNRDEKQLIYDYRNASPEGKKIILDNAKSTSNILPQEPESSDSKIG